jgi:hypothetical protein
MDLFAGKAVQHVADDPVRGRIDPVAMMAEAVPVSDALHGAAAEHADATGTGVIRHACKAPPSPTTPEATAMMRVQPSEDGATRSNS